MHYPEVFHTKTLQLVNRCSYPQNHLQVKTCKSYTYRIYHVKLPSTTINCDKNTWEGHPNASSSIEWKGWGLPTILLERIYLAKLEQDLSHITICSASVQHALVIGNALHPPLFAQKFIYESGKKRRISEWMPKSNL